MLNCFLMISILLSANMQLFVYLYLDVCLYGTEYSSRRVRTICKALDGALVWCVLAANICNFLYIINEYNISYIRDCAAGGLYEYDCVLCTIFGSIFNARGRLSTSNIITYIPQCTRLAYVYETNFKFRESIVYWAHHSPCHPLSLSLIDTSFMNYSNIRYATIQ